MIVIISNCTITKILNLYVDMDEFHPCHGTMPLYVKTFANSTLPEDAQVSETSSKRHDKPAVCSQSTIHSLSSSRTSSNSSDIVLTGMNGFGNVKRRGSKNKGNVLSKVDKKAPERSPSSHQRTDTGFTSRSSAPSVLDTIKCTVESATLASAGVVQTSAVATNTKSTTSTLSSSGKQAWMHGRNLIPSGVTAINSRQPQAADTPDGNSSGSSNLTNGVMPAVTSTCSLHKRRTSAPVFSSRMVSTGVNYAASVKANLPSITATTVSATQLPTSPLNVTAPATLHTSPSSISTLPATATTSASSSEGCDHHTYASRASVSVSKPLQDSCGDDRTAKPPQNLVAASDSINLILQDLDSAAAMRKESAPRKGMSTVEASTDSEILDGSSDIDVLEHDWESSEIMSSSECNNGDDKMSELFSILANICNTYTCTCIYI